MGSSLPARFKLAIRHWLNDSHVFYYVTVVIRVSVQSRCWSGRERERKRWRDRERERESEKRREWEGANDLELVRQREGRQHRHRTDPRWARTQCRRGMKILFATNKDSYIPWKGSDIKRGRKEEERFTIAGERKGKNEKMRERERGGKRNRDWMKLERDSKLTSLAILPPTINNALAYKSTFYMCEADHACVYERIYVCVCVCDCVYNSSFSVSSTCSVMSLSLFSVSFLFR